MGRNVSSDMCAQRRFRSDCAFAQSDQNLHWAHFGEPRMQRVFMWPAKTLVRLHACAGWFESSLDSHVRRYVSGRCGSNVSACVNFRPPLIAIFSYSIFSRLPPVSLSLTDYWYMWLLDWMSMNLATDNDTMWLWRSLETCLYECTYANIHHIAYMCLGFLVFWLQIAIESSALFRHSVFCLHVFHFDGSQLTTQHIVVIWSCTRINSFGAKLQTTFVFCFFIC